MDKYDNMDAAALAAEYLERVGYDPFMDDPTITPDEVRQTLREIDEESGS